MSSFTETTECVNPNNFVPQLTKYVNWVLVVLATDSSIDHRNYNNYENKSKLYDLFKTNLDLALSVSTVCEELNSDEEFTYQVQTIMDLIGLEQAQENQESEQDDEDPEDNLYETREELFNYVHNFIGLNEIQSLHGDSQDKFKEKFFEVVLGI